MSGRVLTGRRLTICPSEGPYFALKSKKIYITTHSQDDNNDRDDILSCNDDYNVNNNENTTPSNSDLVNVKCRLP